MFTTKETMPSKTKKIILDFANTPVSSSFPENPYWENDSDFNALTASIQDNLIRALNRGDRKLFCVESKGLYEEGYLKSFARTRERQYHTCNCCHSFIRNYGNLVTLTESGQVKSALWDVETLPADIPQEYRDMVGRMQRTVERRRVVGLFEWAAGPWGSQEAGGWNHFWANPGAASSPKRMDKTPSQLMAEHREDRKCLVKAMSGPDLQLVHLNAAIGMLKTGELARSEALLPIAKFLKRAWGGKSNNQFWYYVGQAAPGWCTPRSSAIGALIADIAMGNTVSMITHKHNVRCGSLNYQRPKAAPTTGNIRQAEALFDKMGLASALARRPMFSDEVPYFWEPNPDTLDLQAAGIFNHLLPGDPRIDRQLNSQYAPITFAKFRRTVLPEALEIKVVVPHGHAGFFAFTTATDPTALPLLKWDDLKQRNPAAWYLYGHGSEDHTWGLQAGEAVPVLGLSTLPPEWTKGESYEYLLETRIAVVLEGARDKDSSCSALFPNCIRADLHSVRSVIEAQSNGRSLDETQTPRARASGLLISKNSPINLIVRTAEGFSRYCIDRLE